MSGILITGGDGLLGKYMKQIFPDANFPKSSEYDLTLCSDVTNMFETFKPEIVVHCAAKVGGLIDNITYPADYYDDNTLMNTLVLKNSKNYNVKRFIGILSSCLYPDNVNQYPLTEDIIFDGIPNKETLSYGMSKRNFALQIESYNKQYGTNYQYLIPCNLYGNTDKDDDGKSHFVTSLIKKIYESKKNNDDYITLFGDGTPIRQFLHAEDMSKLIKLIIDNDIYDSFNVANNEILSIEEIAKLGLKVTNSENIKIKYDLSKPSGQYRKDLDIKKLTNKIPNYKFIQLKDGLKSFYDYYSTKKNGE
jgi:GDP-L-fucose synthase